MSARGLRQRNLERIRQIRETARREPEALLRDPFWIAGLVAYWAEGGKTELAFANSDPAMIRLFVAWAKRYLAVDSSRFVVRLHLHDGQDEAERKQYWSSVVGVSLSQFRSTFIKPEGSGHRKNILYHGTAQIRILRSGDLLHRIHGWLDAVVATNAVFGTLTPGR